MIYENQEWEINLKDMLFYILHSWKKIILAAVCFGIVLGILLGVRSWYVLNTQSNVTIERDIIDEYETQKNLCENRVSLLEENLESQKDYLDNSLLMKINYHKAANASASLYISTQTDNSAAMLAAYEMLMYNNDFLNFAADEVGIQRDYLEELISAEYDERNVLLLSVVHNDETEAEIILDMLLNEIENKHVSVESIVGKHTVKVIHKRVCTGYNEQIMEKQIVERERLSAIEADLKIAYAEQAALQNPLNRGTSNVPSSVIKGFVLGAFLGAFAVAALLACKFLFGNMLYSAEEMHTRLNLVCLGSVIAEKKISKLDLLIRKIEGRLLTDYEENINLISEKIQIYIGEQKSVLLTGSADKESVSMLAELLQNRLGDIKVDVCGNVLEKVEHIRKMRNGDNIILVEACKKTNYKDIIHEIELIQQSNKKLVGFITIE